MKYLVDSFPYKPRQTVYYVRDNAVHKGVIVSSVVNCLCLHVDRDKVLTDCCSVNILPDSQLKVDEPIIHTVDSDDVHFMYEACQHALNQPSDKDYDDAICKINPLFLGE